MKTPAGYDVTYAIGKAISVNDSSGHAVPYAGLYDIIVKYAMLQAGKYEEALLVG